MQGGYYQAVGGLVTQFNRLDVVSNNIANVNTIGFKRDDVVVGDFMKYLKGAQDELPYKNHTRDAAGFINRTLDRVPQIVEEYTNFESGSLAKTSNPLDVALKSDDLFFTIQTSTGIKYTRAGSFAVDGEGNLTTKDGHKVVSTTSLSNGQPIKIPQEATDLIIDPQGNISVKLPGQVNAETIATLNIAKFDNTKTLKKVGDNMFEATQEARVSKDSNMVVQGFIEKSNVNVVKEMVSLIETNRLVGMYQKVMDSQMNDLNSDAINKLAAARA